MFVKLIVTLFLVYHSVQADVTPKCGPNEEYSLCATQCPLTCNKNSDRACPDVCITGCACKKGFVKQNLTSVGCIAQSDCKAYQNFDVTPQCGPNEEYSLCATQCPLTCNKKSPIVCPDVCTKGCACKKGFVRQNLTSVGCIAQSECKVSAPTPVCQDENQVYQQCGVFCSWFCNESPHPCPYSCQGGCVCKSGYRTERITGKCVKAEDCPLQQAGDEIKCGPNEILKDSGITCQTCTNYQYVKCAPVQKRQCYCLDGYVRRDDNKQCTAIENCPKITSCGD